MTALLQRLRQSVDRRAVWWVLQRARRGELPRHVLHQVLEKLAAAAGAKIELRELP